jgi:hypothetical protein
VTVCFIDNEERLDYSWVCWGSGTNLRRKEWKMQLNHPSTATAISLSRAHSAHMPFFAASNTDSLICCR